MKKVLGHFLRFLLLGWVLSFSAHAQNYSTDAALYASRAGWDYSPSAMIDFDGAERVWWCSSPSAGDHAPTVMRDVIRYNERVGSGAWVYGSGGVIVFDPYNSARPESVYKPAWEGIFVCDPSVVRGSWSVVPAGGSIAQTFSYAMYYGTNDPVTNGGPAAGHNSIGVLFSNNGIDWVRPNQLSSVPLVQMAVTNNANYGSGMPVAIRTGVSSGVTLFYFYTDKAANGVVTSQYYVKQSSDGLNFGTPQLVTQKGFGVEGFVGGIPTTAADKLSYLNGAVAVASAYYLAPGNNLSYVYYLAGVCQTNNVNPGNSILFGEARGLCVYRIAADQVSNPAAAWTRVLISDPYGPSYPNTKPIQVEPGFLTDLFGAIWGANTTTNPTKTIRLRFGCSGTGNPSAWELCSGSGTAP